MWKAHERDVGWVITDLDLMRRRGDVNTEVLQHIARDTRFARLVRTISVRAYDAMEWSDEDDIRMHFWRSLTGLGLMLTPPW